MDLGRNITAQQVFKIMQTGDYGTAELKARALVHKDRRDVTARNLLGQVLSLKGEYREAASHFEACLKLSPKDVETHVLLAEALVNQGRYRQASARYDRALRLAPDFSPAVAGKASVLHRDGEHDKAMAVVKPVVEASREDAAIALIFARISAALGDRETAVEVLSRHRNDPGTGREVQRSILHELGQLYDKLRRYDDAFEAYEAGNAVSGAGPWNPAAMSESFDHLLEVFSPQRLARLPRAQHGSEVPVFIVGVPRCGSTLCEQIIDAHPQAVGAGELPDMPQLVKGIEVRVGSINPYPSCVAEFTQADVDALAADYLQKLTAHGRHARRICDKYLGNYTELGLISILFPQARVIHTRRNALDCCISCFSHRFPSGVPAWQERLDYLGWSYNDYLHLMEGWRQRVDAMGVEMLEIDYEELVTNQEHVSRRIIDFCGLEWDDACLRYHQTGRKVMTLSREQVNKPMYRTAVERWRNYEKHLGPLIDILERGERGNGTIRAGMT